MRLTFRGKNFVADQMVVVKALRGDVAGFDGSMQCAAGFGVVATVAEAALSGQFAKFDEALKKVVRRKVREAECLQSGAVD